jgi:small subunit ribosomal protein S1
MTDRQPPDSREHQLEALIETTYDYNRPRRGEVREAMILSISENDMVVDLGAKRDGIVPPKDLELVDDAYRAGLAVGSRVPVVVVNTRGDGSGMVVSLNEGLQEQDWLRARSLLDSGEVLEGEVTHFNRGGVVVPLGRLRGFVPNSHLSSVPRRVRREQLRDAKAELVGQTLSLVVIEVNQHRRRLILSERVARSRRRRRLLEELCEGQVRTGTVSNVVDFGAFVDLGGFDGLIHISELDHRHVDHPSEVLSEGDEVEVEVLEVDRERERVALSRKRLLRDPWDIAIKGLQRGQLVEGTVTGVVDFGVFVDLGAGVEGLVHVSDMPRGKLGRMELGSPVTVRVLRVDDQRRRIALSVQDAGAPHGD